MAKKRIIGIMGLGHVGAHVAYSLAIQGIADELVLADQNQHKASPARFRISGMPWPIFPTGSLSGLRTSPSWATAIF